MLKGKHLDSKNNRLVFLTEDSEMVFFLCPVLSVSLFGFEKKINHPCVCLLLYMTI